MEFSLAQQTLIQAPLNRKLFVTGPAGTGKTTAGTARLHWLITHGAPAHNILILTPQRTLALPYDEARHAPQLRPGGLVTLATVGALARRMVDLFWPLAAEEAGFAQPQARPIFLTLETAQYFMARVVAPLVEEGYFQSIAISRNRLYSQIIDNLNKAAVVGFPITEIAPRLKSAWVGEKTQLRIYDEAQECALRFRRYCLEHNLLDFSLQMEVFLKYLWPEPLCRTYLLEQYPHLIVDNLEEDTPVAHELLRDWLPHAASALLIYDEGGGHRSFLGADPESAAALAPLCDEPLRFTDSFVASAPILALAEALGAAIASPSRPAEAESPAVPATVKRHAAVRSALHYELHRFHPEMLDWTADTIAGLVHHEGLPPAEIAVLAPFLPDALRFALAQRLEQRDVPVRSHRPSRALREESAAQALLTLAALGHPGWGLCPPRYDVAYALAATIEALDLVRAQLLTDILYRVKDGCPRLEPFAGLQTEVQQRITYLLGGRYEALRLWLERYREAPAAELDHFLSRLFGELLSQPGYRFHEDYDAARVAANLIESAQKFRWIAGALPAEKSPAQEYVELVREGVLAAQYLRDWEPEQTEAVLLAPAFTFLMANRPVEVQFWLNVGSTGWWERLYQPLTHPYVLSRHWPVGRLWLDSDEVAAREETLQRLTQGLLQRCRRAVYLGLSELGEDGYEQQGALLMAIQRVLRKLA